MFLNINQQEKYFIAYPLLIVSFMLDIKEAVYFNMSLFKRSFVGAGYSLFGSIANRGLMAAATIFYARFLGAHFYGIYINVLAIINLFVIFSLFGLSNSYTTLLSHIPSKEKRIASVYTHFCSLYSCFSL